jgi:hypothetical protein
MTPHIYGRRIFMFYNDACGEKLSRLGFGCMRLPVDENGAINTPEFEKMVDYAIEITVKSDPVRVLLHQLAHRVADVNLIWENHETFCWAVPQYFFAMLIRIPGEVARAISAH